MYAIFERARCVVSCVNTDGVPERSLPYYSRESSEKQTSEKQTARRACTDDAHKAAHTLEKHTHTRTHSDPDPQTGFLRQAACQRGASAGARSDVMIRPAAKRRGPVAPSACGLTHAWSNAHGLRLTCEARDCAREKGTAFPEAARADGAAACAEAGRLRGHQLWCCVAGRATQWTTGTIQVAGARTCDPVLPAC